MPGSQKPSTKAIGTDTSILLQMVFLYLKLSGKVAWSWTVVFIPTWIGCAIIAMIILLTRQSGNARLFNCRDESAIKF